MNIDKLYEEKKYIHDMTFYKCVDYSNIDFKSKLISNESQDIIESNLDEKESEKLDSE